MVGADAGEEGARTVAYEADCSGRRGAPKLFPRGDCLRGSRRPRFPCLNAYLKTKYERSMVQSSWPHEAQSG